MQSVLTAVSRARFSILTVALAYWLSILVGALMVHGGSTFALNYRDRIVGDAARSDAASIAGNEGDNFKAAMLDFAGNLFMGAVPKTIAGGSIILPFPLVVYQGWIGGIVSVRGDHTSRLNNVRPALYYLITLMLQISAYSLAVGAGVNVGVALIRPGPSYRGEKWLRIFPKEALRDVARIYALVVPLFLVGSLWEFLSPWNF